MILEFNSNQLIFIKKKIHNNFRGYSNSSKHVVTRVPFSTFNDRDRKK